MVDYIRWNYWPRSEKVTADLFNVVEAFKQVHSEISSSGHNLKSNEVLDLVRPGLTQLGFQVETGKKREDRIRVPVLYGENGRAQKSFEADAFNENLKIVIEVEAGRAVVNNQFLKDVFQAIVMPGVDFLIIAVRNSYR